MKLNSNHIARMIDLSCVRTWSTRSDIDEMVDAAIAYGFGQVSVLQCYIPYTRERLVGHNNIKIVGNVSFPSGSDSTSIKILQAKEMVQAGCNEIDMVMNIGKLKSGEITEVEADVKAVAAVVHPLPLKVIIEIMCLTPAEVRLACQVCLNAGADFVKTGTGWANRGTTLEDVRLVRSIVGDRIQIKASGGIRNLPFLLDLYHAGARRFGVNLKSGIEIVQEAASIGDIEVDAPEQENQQV